MNEVFSQNNLNYFGKVDLYIIKNKKEIHLATLNEGLIGISELFTRAVLGYSVNDFRPWFVDLVSTDGTSMLYEPAEVRAASFDVIDGQTGDDSYLNGWKYPVLDALILSENIVNISSGLAYIYLLSKNKTQLARVEINIEYDSLEPEESDLPTLNLKSGNNILVRWSMYLSNKQKEN